MLKQWYLSYEYLLLMAACSLCVPSRCWHGWSRPEGSHRPNISTFNLWLQTSSPSAHRLVPSSGQVGVKFCWQNLPATFASPLSRVRANVSLMLTMHHFVWLGVNVPALDAVVSLGSWFDAPSCYKAAAIGRRLCLNCTFTPAIFALCRKCLTSS